MTEGLIRVGIISTDVRFRDRLREALSESGRGFRIALELSVRFAEFGEEQVQALRHAAPDLLIVDLEDDPEVGVKLIQFLAESHPSHRVLAVGPTLSPDVLLAAMRAGVSDYLQKPIEPDALRESLQRVTALMGRAGESGRKPGQVFSIFGAKGGTGSTTLATNLGIVLHRLTGKRTLLVDLDLELGEVAVQLGVRPRFNLVDMIQNFHRMDAGLLASFIEQHSSGVHLLSAPFHPERAEATSAEEIRKILQFLKHHYDALAQTGPVPRSGAGQADRQSLSAGRGDRAQGGRADPGPQSVLDPEQRL